MHMPKLVASYVSMQALRGACLRRVKLPGPLPMALASQRTLALSSHTSTVLWLILDYVWLSYQATKASARQCMLTFKGALCAGGVKYSAVRKTPEALLATPTRFPFKDRRGPAHTTSAGYTLIACSVLTAASKAQRLTVCKSRRFVHRGKDSAPAEVTSEQLIQFLEPLVTPARAQRIRQVLHRPAYQARLLSLRP